MSDNMFSGGGSGEKEAGKHSSSGEVGEQQNLSASSPGGDPSSPQLGSVVPGAAPSLTGGGGGATGTDLAQTVDPVYWATFPTVWGFLPTPEACGAFGAFCREVTLRQNALAKQAE